MFSCKNSASIEPRTSPPMFGCGASIRKKCVLKQQYWNSVFIAQNQSCSQLWCVLHGVKASAGEKDARCRHRYKCEPRLRQIGQAPESKREQSAIMCDEWMKECPDVRRSKKCPPVNSTMNMQKYKCNRFPSTRGSFGTCPSNMLNDLKTGIRDSMELQTGSFEYR